MIENKNEMIYIHDNELKNIAEYNLLHDIINPPKRAKNMNIHYSPVLHVCMNTIEGREKFKNFRRLLCSECSPTILIIRIVEKQCPEKDFVMQWQMQARNINTNLRF